MSDEAIRLPKRERDSHKGSYGKGLLIGGSRGMAGAIGLAGIATLRTGAGLVKLAVPESILETVASFEPSYTTWPLPADAAGRFTEAAYSEIAAALGDFTAIAIGPGLGRSADLTRLVERLYRECPLPLVLDADALNALAQRSSPLADRGGARILTPHISEFRRLLRNSPQATPAECDDFAHDLAGEFGVTIVLKGHRSLITNGSHSRRNDTGNPGMATGGSGDVLTGIILGLLCQGFEPFVAASLGCRIHGLAGDLAAAELGEHSLIASDLLRFLPQAVRANAE